MKNKRKVCSIICGLMTISLVACGNRNQEEAQVQEQQTTEQQSSAESGSETTTEVMSSESSTEELNESGNGMLDIKLPEGVEKVLAEKEKYPELEQIIIDKYEIPEEALASTRYYYNYIDIDEDGTDEIVAVIVGMYTSGSGGDSGLIVRKNGDSLEIEQAFTLIRTPIIISSQATNGRKDIIVMQSGGGAKTAYKRMTYQNGSYTTVDQAEEVTDMDAIEGTAIICNDMEWDMQTDSSIHLAK